MQTNINEIKDAVFNSTTGVFANMADAWPNILISLSVILIGIFIGWIVEKIIIKSGNKLKLNTLAEKTGLNHLLQKAKIKTHISVLIAKLIKGYIIFMFLMASASILGLTQIADFLETVIAYIPNVIIGIAILLIGMRFGNTAAVVTETTLRVANSSTAKVVGNIAKYTIVFFAVMAALSQLKIANEIVMTLFVGFVSMLALGGGLAFGLGGKDFVKQLLDDFKKQGKK